MINDWLRRTYGLLTTGLTEREDFLFESSHIRPIDVLLLLEDLATSPQIVTWLAQSHYQEGLRQTRPTDRTRCRRALAIAKVLGRVAPQTYQQHLVAKMLTAPPSSFCATKEGVLPARLSCDGASYRHEAGLVLESDILVVVCTKDGDTATLAALGEVLNHWHT